MSNLEPYNKFFADGQKFGHDTRCLVAIGNWHKAVDAYSMLADLATVESANRTMLAVKYRSGANLQVRLIAQDRDIDNLKGHNITHLVVENDIEHVKLLCLKMLLRSTVVPNCNRNVTYA